LRSVCSEMPSSRATTATPCPSLTRCTAACLNAAVYDCFGTLNMSDSLPLRRVYTRLMEGEISGEAQCRTPHRENSTSDFTALVGGLPYVLLPAQGGPARWIDR